MGAQLKKKDTTKVVSLFLPFGRGLDAVDLIDRLQQAYFRDKDIE